jgi:transcription initiation factor TFIIIB Brf1 subunit/transcription initiation factor TFIIB
VNEKRELMNDILPEIADVGSDMCWAQAVIRKACANIMVYVQNQHLWVTATYRQLAVASMYVAAVRSQVNMPRDLAKLASKRYVDEYKIRGMLPEVRHLLVDKYARATIAAFMPKFENLVPKLASEAENTAAKSLKLWTKVQKTSVFPSD